MTSTPDLAFSKGFPLPFGLSIQEEGINFALASTQALAVSLCIYKRQGGQLLKEIPLCAKQNKTGDVWHILISHLPTNLTYAYKIQHADINNQSKLVLFADPYAKSMATSHIWGHPNLKKLPSSDTQPGIYHPIADIYTDTYFDWEGVSAPNLRLNDLILYEMHVRGFTKDPSSQVAHPGTFLGIIEKIPHLIDLGVNAIELLPIQEFNESEYALIHPNFKKPLFNYWGYSTINFFAPMNRYATTDQRGAAIHEFKTMVKELHRNGIEVILDVVFNHTAEGGKEGPVLSFKGIDPAVFYLLDKEGNYSNFSGCGNTCSANQPRTLELIISCLRYWVIEMHVDGFRFDLASALTRDTDGSPMKKPPLIEAIKADPILAKTKLIAEPWDAVGFYQVGNFAPETKRWSEWNGKYRDAIRRFIKGNSGASGEFAMRMCGSQDLYHNRGPSNSINFITAHDGFTLHDLVSYNEKHNLPNGEDNRDGLNENESWNCGTEGKTTNRKVLALRHRQMRNFHLALMVSQGIPMLHMGDEYGHTKNGNNNTWCQDNVLNWFLWDKLDAEEEFHRFYRNLIHFRKNHRLLRRTTFLTDSEIDWHGIIPFKADWNGKVVACTLKDPVEHQDLYIAFNAGDDAVALQLPNPPRMKEWHWIVNTANASPFDIYDVDDSPICKDPAYKMPPHSSLLLKAF